MLTTGIERLTARGAQRLKIGFESAPAAALYEGLGFQRTTTVTSYGGDVHCI